MKTYAVSTIIAGRSVAELVVASSASDAIAVVKARYGNVPIVGTRIVG